MQVVRKRNLSHMLAAIASCQSLEAYLALPWDQAVFSNRNAHSSQARTCFISSII